MSTKNDYSSEEWKAIASAPVAAGMFITLADTSGPVGIAKEAMAVGRAITDAAQGQTPEIVKAIAMSMKESGRPETPEIPMMAPRAKSKLALTNTIRSAVDAVERHSPSEVEPYKAWLAAVAKKVAEAAKEGGFLGMGGTLVSQKEEDALKELDAVLH
jgi:D-tyrosyl-tRNA(Tyr) deacylase